MEQYIPISFLNDFIFCPKSLYNHQLYGNFAKSIYQQKPQLAGLNAHKAIDQKKYSTKKTILQSYDIYSDKYKLYGKIDTFDTERGLLRERKNHIITIYDGYVFQVYAQCHALREMGFEVNKIELYDISANRIFPISLPENNPDMQDKFEKTICDLNSFDVLKDKVNVNPEKCKTCIYNLLCDQSLC